MSLILEALRKSEAERRRGQVPNLHSELPPVAPSARSRQPAWPWLVALAVIAMVATTWLARGWWTPTASVADTSDQVRAETDRAASASMDSSVADTVRVDALASIAEAEPMATEPPAPITATPSANVAATAASPARPATASIDPAPQPQFEPAEPAAPPVRGSDPDSDRSTAVATAVPPAIPPAPRTTASPTTPAVAANQPKAPATAAATLDTPSPLRLSDLAAAERRSLPPLKVSMHLWAPTSERRFAIIDGARVNEGDRLGDAVVDEITRDGVVLAWHGRRVHIPIH